MDEQNEELGQRISQQEKDNINQIIDTISKLSISDRQKVFENTPNGIPIAKSLLTLNLNIIKDQEKTKKTFKERLKKTIRHIFPSRNDFNYKPETPKNYFKVFIISLVSKLLSKSS